MIPCCSIMQGKAMTKLSVCHERMNGIMLIIALGVAHIGIFYTGLFGFKVAFNTFYR